MRIILAAMITVVISGCDAGSAIPISTSEWVCSKVARVGSSAPALTGKMAMLLPESSIECVQWTRMSEQL